MNNRIKDMVLATNNHNKLGEITFILDEYIKKTKHKLDINFELIEKYTRIEAVEDGDSFEENALIKAQFAYLYSNKPCLSEDSGLCIDALDGAPGIYSKRWNEDGDDSYERAFEKIKKLMKFSSNFDAKFVCVFCLYEGKDKYQMFRGELLGKINFPAIGDNGFAYDRIFVPKDSTKSLAQMNNEEKNAISHRRKACEQVLEYLVKQQ